MSWQPRWMVVGLLLAVVTPIIVETTSAQAPRIDVNSLMNETQKSTPRMDAITMVWWMPEEFWRVMNEGPGRNRTFAIGLSIRPSQV